jgi:hypothetical protein
LDDEGATASGGGDPAAGDGFAEAPCDCANPITAAETKAAAARRMRRLFIGAKAGRY